MTRSVTELERELVNGKHAAEFCLTVELERKQRARPATGGCFGGRPRSLGPYLAVGRGYKGMLAIARGDARGGVESLQGCLEVLHAARYELLTPTFNISLAEGLAALGRLAKALR